MSTTDIPVNAVSKYWQDAVATFAALPTGTQIGELRQTLDSQNIYRWDGAAWNIYLSETGTVVGPGTSVNGEIALFNGTTGSLLKRSTGTGLARLASGVLSASTVVVPTEGGTGTTTQFTSGSLVFAGASGVYSQDNANLFWDATNKILEPKNCGVNTTDLSEIVATGGNCIFAVGGLGSSRMGYQPNFNGFLAVTNGTVTGYVAHPTGGTDGLAVGTASSDNFTIRLGNANRAQFQFAGGFWTASYAISLGSLSSSHMVTGVLSNNSTSVVNDVFCCRFDGAAGAASSGIGAGLTFRVNTSTTFAIDSGQVASGWSTVTHASRIGFLTLSAYDSAAAREGLRISTSGSAAQISFLGATPVVQQASGADLTNSVIAGGTTDTVANYTDLVIYANDAAAIRNDIYQLARKLKQINDALRLYGLLT